MSIKTQIQLLRTIVLPNCTSKSLYMFEPDFEDIYSLEKFAYRSLPAGYLQLIQLGWLEDPEHSEMLSSSKYATTIKHAIFQLGS